MARDGSWPIVWERARDVYVWDDRGKQYLDLTAAFGVAAAGHANAKVVRAAREQMGKLLHAMGDVHPHALKGKLARELSRLTFERWSGHRGKTIFCNSGFEAVEAALKTALLATGKPGVIAFTGGYHGLGYGALNVTTRQYFREPFVRQLANFGCFAPFPETEEAMAGVREGLVRVLRRHRTGAILVEPMQARGGIKIPAPQFLPMLRELADEHGALLIFDEIYTGFGRTGKWFGCEHSGASPDIVCLGKALTGGFPLSACVGRASVMDRAWPRSKGEALHTSTYLGHPVGCAMALAQIQEIRERRLVTRSAALGTRLLERLSDLAAMYGVSARGVGLFAGLELQTARQALTIIKRLLHRGFIFLPEGEQSNVISVTPPLTIQQKHLDQAISALAEELE